MPATEVADTYTSSGTAARINTRIPPIDEVAMAAIAISGHLVAAESVTLMIGPDYPVQCLAICLAPASTGAKTGTLLATAPSPPVRQFPFARHLDLLNLPEVEGVFCDPDEFLDR
jgi:hypothetical protein